MTITLGKRGDYAIRAVLELARQGAGARLKAREIAAAMEIPPKYLPQILAALVRAGILSASAGRNGGYELTRPLSALSLIDVIEAAEPAREATVCVLRNVHCEQGEHCALHEHWLEAQQALRERLSATSFADLVSATGVASPG